LLCGSVIARSPDAHGIIFLLLFCRQNHRQTKFGVARNQVGFQT
jgi:hypothetical protein